MNHLISRSLFIIAIFLSTTSLRAHVALDYPLGGETFIVGQTVLVQWHIAVPHETLNWDLYFSTDAGVNWEPLQLNMPVSQLTYNWEIPNHLTSQGRIRVFMNNVDQDYLDISMNFTIAPNTTPPLLDAPANDTTIECSTGNQQAAIDAWLANHGGASATNFCDGFTWTHDYTGISNGCGASGSTEVIFTAADACGFITTSATLHVVDTQPPVFTELASDMVVLECSQNLGPYYTWINNHGGARAIDLCGIVQWSFDIVVIDDCEGSFFQTVYFIATDNCGNQATTTADFSMDDNTPPVINQQAQDTIIECSAANQETIITNWLNRQGGAQAYDACSPYVSWTNNYSGFNLECGGSGMAEVTFNAIDDCLNISSTTVTLRVEDTIGPVILQQAKDTILDCGDSEHESTIQNWLDHHAGAIVHDQCGTLTWSHDFTPIPDSCIAPFSQVVTFTVLDECFNSTTLDASITFVDTIIPKPVGFLDSSYVWTEHSWFANASQTFSYTFADMPTVISDTIYYELLRSNEEEETIWYGTNDFFRFDNKKVFVRQGSFEGVLFDFNLTEGDTFIEYVSGIPLTVDEIDTIQLQNGELRKQWKLRCDKHQPGLPYEVLWVEGIGNLKGIFGQDLYCQFDGSHYEMLCMDRNDTLLYDNPEVDECWLLPTALDGLNEGSISIYPNPASESITITFGRSQSLPRQVIISDGLGTIHWQSKVMSETISIPINEYSPGIYFLNMEMAFGMISKIIIVL